MTAGGRRLHVGLVALLLLAALPVAVSHESWPYGVLLALAVAASWRPGTRPNPSRPREIVIRVAAVAALLWAVVDWRFRGTTFVLSLAHFVMLIAACKLWERRTARDLSLLLLMALILFLVAAIVSAELVFPVTLVGFLLLGPPMAMRLHLKRENERAAVRRGGIVNRPGSTEPGSDRTGLAAVNVRVTAACVVFGMAVFVLTPRIAGRSSTHWLAASNTFTGFDESADLASSGGILESDDLVMRAWAWRGDRPLVAEEFQPYLRAYSLERYLAFRRGGRTGYGWRPAERTHVTPLRVKDREEATNLVAGPPGTSPDEELQLTVMLERRLSNYLFTRYPPLAIHSPQLSDIGKEVSDQSVFTTVGRRRTPLRYTVWSAPEVTPELLAVLDRERNLVGRPRVPDRIAVSDRVRDKARQLWEEAGRPDLDSPDGRIETLRAVARHLQSAEYTYTLDAPTRPPDAEPVEYFLFSSRMGHCEIYATTMAVLCQSLGIPARYVTGYLGTEFNPVAECFLVRQSDAHAWVEAYVPGHDWMTFDPSPLAAGEDVRAGLWDTLLHYWDFFRYHWINQVVSYDTYSRRALLGQFTAWLTGSDVRRPVGVVPRLTGAIKDLFFGPPGLSWGQRLVYWAVLSLFLLLAAAVIQFAWRIAVMARRRLRPVRLAPGQRYYQRLVRILARGGFVPADGQTPREFVGALAARRPLLDPAPRAVELYYAVRFGRRTPGADESQRMDQLLNELELAVRRVS